MSFVTVIRDYVEALNTVSDSLSQNLTPMTFASETAFYILKTLQGGFLYILSFQWIKDFTLLPIVLPQLSKALFEETFFLETPSNVFFDFLEIPDFHQNKFLLGFFNSFFLSLPFSIVHIISVRRFFIKGVPSGAYSIGGYLTGQILFLTCVVFGIRQVLIPWLTLEPLNYILGLIFIFRIIYSMISETLAPLQTWHHPKYKTFFLTSFLLAWCEQTSIFQYLGNVTLSSNVTLLESFSSSNPVSSFLSHFLYIFGISCGSLVFTCFWGFFFLQLKNLLLIYTPVSLSSFLQKLNTTSFVILVALSLTSLPFYSFEYLVTGPLGFISQDSVFENTPLSQNRLKDHKDLALLSNAESNLTYVDVEAASFDRGNYLIANVDQPLSFEDLNYRGEFEWIARQDKVSNITQSKSGFFRLGNVFKKPRKPESPYANVAFENQQKNRLLLEKNFVPADLELESEREDRFLKEYGEETLKPYSKIYLKTFHPDFLGFKKLITPELERKIKNNYYSNPVYKNLLAVDIDFFLKRQSQDFQLTGTQEFDLYTKRRQLESYYDSLRDYEALPESDSFEFFFDGTKSFSNKVYNQQFKGTLRSVRRLFSLTVNSDETENPVSVSKVLKFDQPSYQFSEKQEFSPYHEELGTLRNQTETERKSDIFGSGTTEFLTNPFYAGWDERARKFVITNKFLPRDRAGYNVILNQEMRPKFSQESKNAKEKILFTVWPLSQKATEVPKAESRIPYVTLFEPVTEELNTTLQLDSEFSSSSPTVPANVQRYQNSLKKAGEAQKEIFISLAPKRGGFLWPGNTEFTFSSILAFFKK
jgi:hypothetical protein